MIEFCKGALKAGVPAGIIWGWLSMGVNSATGAFPFEGTLVYNLIAFGTGGAVFGVTTAGFLGLLKDSLPFKGPVPKAVFVSTAVWLLLRVAGAMLSHMDHERFHLVTSQSIQGLALAVVLGVMTGLLFKRAAPSHPETAA